MPTSAELYQHILNLEGEIAELRALVDPRKLKTYADAQRLLTFIEKRGGFNNAAAIRAAREARFRSSESAFQRLMQVARDLRAARAVRSTPNTKEVRMAIPRVTSQGAKALSVKDVSAGIGATPGPIGTPAHSKPAAPAPNTPRAAETGANGKTGGNYNEYEGSSNTGPGFQQQGVGKD